MKAILLHHAGGDKYAFRNVQQWLQPEIETIALEIPGRGDRFSESLVYSIEEMVDDLYPKVIPHTEGEFCFVGMSMGALLSFLITHKLKQENRRMPEYMFMASRMPFPNYEANIDFAAISSDDFWEYIVSYDVRSKPIATNIELRSFYEPILRADFIAMQSYHHSFAGLPKLPVQAAIYYGTADKKVIDENRIQEWSNYFEPEPEYKSYEEGHFFFYESQQSINNIKAIIAS